jgi:hypothetical protein
VGDTKLGIAVIATAWGTRHGGVNSFSTDLCLALARVLPNHRIACVVLSAEQAEIEQAKEVGVHVVPLHLDPDSGVSPQWAGHVLGALSGIGDTSWQWMVGHDVITGELAASCAHQNVGSRCSVIMHMSYDDYAYVKHTVEDAAAVAEKAGRQRRLLMEADHAFAVGPLLFDRLREIRNQAIGGTTLLIPGLLEKAPPLESKRLHVITFGRFEPSDALIKQAPLAVAAFAEAVRTGFDSSQRELKEARITVIGAPPGAAKELRDLAAMPLRAASSVKPSSTW